MYCRKCGSLVDDDSIFCKVCGTRLAGTGGDVSPAVGDGAEAVSPPAGSPPLAGDAPLSPAPDDGKERDLWEGMRSWKKFFVHYLLAALFCAGGVVFLFVVGEESAARVPVLGGVLREAWGTLRFVPLCLGLLALAAVWAKTFLYTRSLRYRLTTDRFFVVRGILSRSMDELELIRVNDVVMRQGVWERMLGIGSVTILSNDETTPRIVLGGIEAPERVKEKIRGAAAARRAAGLYVERI